MGINQTKTWVAGFVIALLPGSALPANSIVATSTGARTETYNTTMRVYSHDTECDGRGSQARWTRSGSSSIYEWNNNQGCNTGTYTTTGGTYFVSAQACSIKPLSRSICGSWQR